MADYRPLYCSFWTDPDMEQLNPNEKLVYAFLFTCHLTTESGIYAISEKFISERTNISIIKIKEILNTLQCRYHKITYDNGIIFVHSFLKRNYKGNPKMLNISILRSFDNYPSKTCWSSFLEIYKRHCISIKIKEKLDTLPSVGDTSLSIEMSIDNDNDKKEGIQGEKEKKKFEPPSFEEFRQYCKENNHEGIAERAFKGYEVAGWYDSQGKPVKSWRGKLQHVWFREDNRDAESAKPKKPKDPRYAELCKQNERDMQVYRNKKEPIPEELLNPKWLEEYA
jgi:hypothetical protein